MQLTLSFVPPTTGKPRVAGVRLSLPTCARAGCEQQVSRSAFYTHRNKKKRNPERGGPFCSSRCYGEARLEATAEALPVCATDGCGVRVKHKINRHCSVAHASQAVDWAAVIERKKETGGEWRPCKKDGCEDRAWYSGTGPQGFCEGHRRSVRAAARAKYTARRNAEVCDVDGCTGKKQGPRMCAAHLRRLALGLDMTAPIRHLPSTPRVRQVGECDAPGCTEPKKVRGHCSFHIQRMRSGVPLDAPFGNSGGSSTRPCPRCLRATTMLNSRWGEGRWCGRCPGAGFMRVHQYFVCGTCSTISHRVRRRGEAQGSHFCSDSCASIARLLSMDTTSEPERECARILVDDFGAMVEKAVFGFGEVDIWFPELGDAGLEFNGCYWHAHGCDMDPGGREARRVRDLRKGSDASDAGFRVAVLWECDFSREPIGSTRAALLAADIDPDSLAG